MRRALLAVALTALVPLGLTAAPATAAMAAAPATASAAVRLATAMPGASRAPATAQTPSPFVQQNFCQSHPTIPSTGTSGSVKVFNIKTLAKGCLAGIHACEATGNDGTNEGVMCADL
jgi:hypothetical protein